MNKEEENTAFIKKKNYVLPSTDENNKPLCFICKKYGHISKYCHQNTQSNVQQNKKVAREKTQNNSPTTMTAESNMKMSKKHKYLQEVLVNGKPIKVYIDLEVQLTEKI